MWRNTFGVPGAPGARVRAAAAMLFALVLAGPAAAAQPRPDLQIFRDVSAQVLRYAQFTIFDHVDASVDAGHVVLGGFVTMPFKKDDLERRVRAVAGVVSVDNRLEVLPVSIFDDDLRFRIARAIYGNSAFWNYAAMAHPPIHIIVNRGRVTLTGVVQNNVERMLARSLATGLGALEVKNELRTDAEAASDLEKIGAGERRDVMRP